MTTTTYSVPYGDAEAAAAFNAIAKHMEPAK